MNLMSGSKSQITFEHVGGRDSEVETNYLVDGIAGSNQNQVHNLAFPASGSFHTYSISWTPLTIQWWIDGQPVRTMATPLGLLNGAFAVDIVVWDACSGAYATCDWAGGVPTDYSGGKTYTARIDSVGYRTLGLLPGP